MGYRGQSERNTASSCRSALAHHSKKNAAPLLQGIETLLTEYTKLDGKEAAERVRRHLLSQLLCLGRHTVTGVLSTAGRLQCDWSADYRMYSAQRINPHALFTPVRKSLTNRLAPGEPLVTAVDDTRIRKTGRKTYGVKYMRDPLGPPFHVNFITAQRFLQLSMASPAANGMVRMVPIDFVHTPAPRKPSRKADAEAHRIYRTAQRDMALPKIASDRLRDLRKAMDEDHEHDRPLWSVVDGGFTNGTFLKSLPSRTTMIGRIRADAKLYYFPESSVGMPGRNRVYGRRAPTPEALRQDDSVPWMRVTAFAAGRTHQFKIKTLAPLRWRAAGENHTVRLIVIAPLGYRLTKQSPMLYRKPAYLICTDPEASIGRVLQAYLWRCDIEVNFRDEKTLLGVGQAQVRNDHSVERVPVLAVAAYAMMLTAAIQAYGLTGKPTILPTPKWRRKKRLRASTQLLINHLRHEVWAKAIRFSSFVSHHTGSMKPEKSNPNLESALFYATA
jgi:SRSO17 transposase